MKKTVTCLGAPAIFIGLSLTAAPSAHAVDNCIANAEFDQVTTNMKLNDVHDLFDGYTGAFQLATPTLKARAYNNCHFDHNGYIEYTLRGDGFWKVSYKNWRNGTVAD